MKAETFRTALRAAGALTGMAACSSPTPTTTPAAVREPDCVAITDQAFGTTDDYPGTKIAVSGDVLQCCNASMTSETSAVFSRHRWACCANKTVEPQPASACIPWGPPVPPSMARGITA